MLLLLVSAAFVSCSDDDDFIDKNKENFDELFQSLKGDYSGNLILADNSSKQVKFSIVDETTNGTTSTNVKVTDFPLDNILYKLYPNDYANATVTAIDTYVAPIDSIGFPSTTLMNFKTDDEQTEEINFSYTKDSETHSGRAKVSTVGLYNGSSELLEITFNIIDLVIDDKDYYSLLPISYVIDSEKQ